MGLEPKDKAKQIYYECETKGLDIYGGMMLHKNDIKESALTCVSDKLEELNKIESKDLSDLQYWSEVEYEIKQL